MRFARYLQQYCFRIYGTDEKDRCNKQWNELPEIHLDRGGVRITTWFGVLTLSNMENGHHEN